MAVKADKCELWASGQWQLVSVEDVIAKWVDRKLRCQECHGAVKAFKEGANGHPAHFEHKDAHSGCSLCHIYKQGQPLSQHPKALT